MDTFAEWDNKVSELFQLNFVSNKVIKFQIHYISADNDDVTLNL